MPDKWEIALKENIKRIEEQTPEDRLEISSVMRECWRAINRSQRGWDQWLQNLELLNLLPKDLMLKFLDIYRKCTIALLKFDMASTRAVIPFIIESKKKTKNIQESRFIS